MRRLCFALALSIIAAAPLAAQTLLVGNKNEDSVSVIDLAMGKERARVATGKMPHEIAVSPDGKQAAVVAYGGTTIDILDIAGAARRKRIDLAPNARPHGLVWLADGRLLATTEGSKTLTVVDPVTGMVNAIATRAEGSHMLAASPSGDRAYVANMGSGTVSVIDLRARRVLREVAIGGQPEGIALTPDGRELWVADRAGDRLIGYDIATLRPVATVAVGETPIRVAITPDGRHAVTSNYGGGDLTVVDLAARMAERTVWVSGLRALQQVTILFNADGTRLYVAETGVGRVAELDWPSGQRLRLLEAGKGSDGLALAP